MFIGIKRWLAFIIIKKKYSIKTKDGQSFKDFYKKAGNVFIALPKEDIQIKSSINLLNELYKDEKKITLFLPEHLMEKIREKSKFSFVTYSENDLTKLRLPNKDFFGRYKDKDFDIFIDLEFKESLLNYAIAGLSNADFRIGFKRDDSDRFYNFQVSIEERNYEISCRNLLNSLRMF